jgi:hypothetical protein
MAAQSKSGGFPDRKKTGIAGLQEIALLPGYPPESRCVGARNSQIHSLFSLS